jgi:Mor family transcriptional regulator
LSSGRLATVELKAKPAAAQTKAAGGAKASWGKPGATKPKAQESASTDGTKIYLSEGKSGFEIPIKTEMFESARI